MDQLEKFFKENEALFNQENPSEEHFERFLHKLEKDRKKRIKFGTTFFLKVAAIIIFVVLSGIGGYQLHHFQVKQYNLGDISPEYQEVELYYTSNISSQLDLIQKLGAKKNEEDQTIFTEELEQMDQLYQQLKKELKANPGDERVIQAMIEYYQVKSNILNKIIDQLYQVKQQNVHNYESTQI
ncbi:MAG: hypothetical protein ACEPOZ_13410 [Marinifilaceae bacterium]|jgi:hypothetical protein